MGGSTVPSRGDISAAAVLSAPFALYLLLVRVVAPPTAANWERADPILTLLPGESAFWLVVGLAALAVAAWLRLARPTRGELMRGARFALLGAAAAGGLILVLRLVAGAKLPAFIPAEESAGPGFTLSMAAGYGEELIFRFGVAAAVFLGLSGRTSRPVAIVLAAVACGLGFALLHSWGEQVLWSPRFVTRFVVPGAVMTAAFLAVNPTFMVVGHCAAHLLIPALFV